MRVRAGRAASGRSVTPAAAIRRQPAPAVLAADRAPVSVPEPARVLPQHRRAPPRRVAEATPSAAPRESASNPSAPVPANGVQHGAPGRRRRGSRRATRARGPTSAACRGRGGAAAACPCALPPRSAPAQSIAARASRRRRRTPAGWPRRRSRPPAPDMPGSAASTRLGVGARLRRRAGAGGRGGRGAGRGCRSGAGREQRALAAQLEVDLGELEAVRRPRHRVQAGRAPRRSPDRRAACSSSRARRARPGRAAGAAGPGRRGRPARSPSPSRSGTSTPTSITVVATSTCTSPRAEAVHDPPPLGDRASGRACTPGGSRASSPAPQPGGLRLGRRRGAGVVAPRSRAGRRRTPGGPRRAAGACARTPRRGGSRPSTRVTTGARPAGSSSSTDTSRSP